MDEKKLAKKTVAELQAMATENKINIKNAKTKAEIIKALLASSNTETTKTPTIQVETKVEEKPIVVVAETPVTKPKPQVASQNPAKPQQQVIAPSTAKPQSAIVTTPRSIQNQTTKPLSQTNNQVPHKPQNHPKHSQPQVKEENKYANGPTIEVTGILEVMSDGTHGVLRTPKLIPTDKDTYIAISQVKKLKLRKGDHIAGTARLPKENERYFSLLWVKTINGNSVEEYQKKERINFDDLKPIYPNKLIKLECGQYPISNRIIDMLAPIGFGQRAMIVAPPKTGKTFLLKDIAKGINENHPEVQLIVVLIGERPEEVTDIERSVNGIVYASNFDDSPLNQVAVAELSLERAKRMVETGKDVIILMDSLTRLARAYNVALPASGRTLSGGLDPVSLYPSKRFFGAARNFENGASLTIVATSLVETGSKMDDVIFEEFKGTGNMELKLDRKLSNKRIFPAIDLLESGTRNEELLLGTDALQDSWKIRKLLENLNGDGNEALIDRMKTTKTNEDFLRTLHQ